MARKKRRQDRGARRRAKEREPETAAKAPDADAEHDDSPTFQILRSEDAQPAAPAALATRPTKGTTSTYDDAAGTDDSPPRPFKQRLRDTVLNARLPAWLGDPAAKAKPNNEGPSTPNRLHALYESGLERSRRLAQGTERILLGAPHRRHVLVYDPSHPPLPWWTKGNPKRFGIPWQQLAKWTGNALALAALAMFLLAYLYKIDPAESLFIDLHATQADLGYAAGILLLLWAGLMRRYTPRQELQDRPAGAITHLILNRQVQTWGAVVLAFMMTFAVVVLFLGILNALGLLPFTTTDAARNALRTAHHFVMITSVGLTLVVMHAVLIDFYDVESTGRLRLTRFTRLASFSLLLVGLAIDMGILLPYSLAFHPVNAIVAYAASVAFVILTYFVQGAVENPVRQLQHLMKRFEGMRNLAIDWTVIIAIVFGITSLVVVAILFGQTAGATGGQVPVFYGVLFLVAVLGALVFILLRLMHLGKEQEKQLARRKYLREEVVEILLVIGSATGALLFAIVGILQLDNVAIIQPVRIFGAHLVGIDYMAYTAFMATGPMSFYMYAKRRRIQAMEDRFPELLRDLAESRRAGLTLVTALRSASHGEYGPLSTEISTMARQLSWGVPFDRVLELFAERIHTPLIDRSISLILEASKAGGRVTDVLLAAARDAREIRLLQRERKIQMSTYIMIVYVAALVFLVVVTIMANMFVPRIVESSAAIASIGSTAGFSGAVLTLGEYVFFYFGSAVVQSIGTGLVAGTLEDGKIVSGFRHAFSLLMISYLAFRIFVL